MLHKGQDNLIFEGTQSKPLCSNKVLSGCVPSAIQTKKKKEDELLEYLSDLITDIYLEQRYENRKTNKIK